MNEQDSYPTVFIQIVVTKTSKKFYIDRCKLIDMEQRNNKKKIIRALKEIQNWFALNIKKCPVIILELKFDEME